MGRRHSDSERDKALDVLELDDLAAHDYLTVAGVADRMLAVACGELAGRGYLIVDHYGALHGKVVQPGQRLNWGGRILHNS